MRQFRIHIYWMIGLEINAHVSQNIGYSHYIHIGVHLYINITTTTTFETKKSNNFWNDWSASCAELIQSCTCTYFQLMKMEPDHHFLLHFVLNYSKYHATFFATIPCVLQSRNMYTTAQLDDKWRRNNKIYETENCNARKFIKLPHWDRIQ